MFLKDFACKYLLSALGISSYTGMSSWADFGCGGGDFLRLKHSIHAKKNTFL